METNITHIKVNTEFDCQSSSNSSFVAKRKEQLRKVIELFKTLEIMVYFVDIEELL